MKESRKYEIRKEMGYKLRKFLEDSLPIVIDLATTDHALEGSEERLCALNEMVYLIGHQIETISRQIEWAKDWQLKEEEEEKQKEEEKND